MSRLTAFTSCSWVAAVSVMLPLYLSNGVEGRLGLMVGWWDWRFIGNQGLGQGKSGGRGWHGHETSDATVAWRTEAALPWR